MFYQRHSCPLPQKSVYSRTLTKETMILNRVWAYLCINNGIFCHQRGQWTSPLWIKADSLKFWARGTVVRQRQEWSNINLGLHVIEILSSQVTAPLADFALSQLVHISKEADPACRGFRLYSIFDQISASTKRTIPSRLVSGPSHSSWQESSCTSLYSLPCL